MMMYWNLWTFHRYFINNFEFVKFTVTHVQYVRSHFRSFALPYAESHFTRKLIKNIAYAKWTKESREKNKLSNS